MALPVLSPSGIFQFRRRVPVELRGLLGYEYKKSLKTRDPAVAEVRQAEELVRCKAAFALARAQIGGTEVLNARDIELLASGWYHAELAKMEASGDFASQLADGNKVILEGPDRYEEHVPLVSLAEALEDDPDLDVSESVNAAIRTSLRKSNIPMPAPGAVAYGRLVVAFRKHLLELSEIALKRHQGDWLTKAEVLPIEPLSIEAQRNGNAPVGKSLLTVFEEYAEEKTLNDGSVRGLQRTIQGFRATVQQFSQLFGDLPVREISRDVMRQYRGYIAQLPVKGEGIRKLSIQELISKAEAENLPRIQEATIRNKLRAMSAVLAYAVRMGDCEENAVIASGIARAAAKAASNRIAANRRRKDYSREELRTIFTSPIYTDEGWTPPRANFGGAWYWMPLLMYYTGARREELAQLSAAEVLTSPDNIWHFSVLASEDGDDAGRSVKTTGSRRLIPMHSDLIRMGFIDYVALQTGGQLFPLLKADADGYFGTNFGKRWASYLREKVALRSTAKPAHGFRHTFKTLSREVGMFEDVHDAITGHAGLSSVARDYGVMPLSRMALEIEKYPTAPGLVPILQTRSGPHTQLSQSVLRRAS